MREHRALAAGWSGQVWSLNLRNRVLMASGSYYVATATETAENSQNKEAR
jgi:hypothetical protein